MGSVRTPVFAHSAVFDRNCAPRAACGQLFAAGVVRMELAVLDVVYVLGTIVLFVVIGLLAKAVEKL